MKSGRLRVAWQRKAVTGQVPQLQSRLLAAERPSCEVCPPVCPEQDRLSHLPAADT